MAMDGDALGAKLWTDIKALHSFSPAISADADAAGLALWKKIANDIVDHIQQNLSVQSSVPVVGVQAGASTVVATGQSTVVT